MDLEYWDVQFYNVKLREISTFAYDSVLQYSVSRVSVRMDCGGAFFFVQKEGDI